MKKLLDWVRKQVGQLALGDRGVFAVVNLIPAMFVVVCVLICMLSWLLFGLMGIWTMPFSVLSSVNYLVSLLQVRAIDLSPLLLLPIVVNAFRRESDKIRENLEAIGFLLFSAFLTMLVCLPPELLIDEALDKHEEWSPGKTVHARKIPHSLIPMVLDLFKKGSEGSSWRDELGVVHYPAFRQGWRTERGRYHCRMVPEIATNVCETWNGGFGWQEICSSCQIAERDFRSFAEARGMLFSEVGDVPFCFINAKSPVFAPIVLQGERLNPERFLYCEKEGPKGGGSGNMQFLYDKESQTLYVDYWD